MNNPTATQIICNLINNIMDEAEPNALTRRVFEYQLVNEGYELDWNKRLDVNGKWVEKELIK